MGDFGMKTSPVPSAKGLRDAANAETQGILSITNSGKYLTGARTIIRINGQLAAFAFGVTWTISTHQDEVITIDDYTPYEFAPKRITVEGTISGFRIPGKSPASLLISPDVLSFLFHKYIEIEVRDRTTDNLLFKTAKAVIVSQSTNIQAEQMATMQLHWKAIGWADEQIPTQPAGINGSKGAAPNPPLGMDLPNANSGFQTA